MAIPNRINICPWLVLRGRHREIFFRLGGCRYIDRVSSSMQTAYPGSMHPKIIPVGDDYFLCIEMLDPAGNAKLVDFLMRRTAVG